MKFVYIVFAATTVSCGGKPAPTNALPDRTTTTPPPVAGAANLGLECRSASPRCDKPGFNMAVLGDRVDSCETQAGTSIRLQLKSSNDEHDLIIIAFDGYHGADTYALDLPSTRFLSVDDDVSVGQCEGGPINAGKRVTAADPNCGSPACTVRIDDAAAAAPFPKALTFTVHCTSLCENGSDVTCPGPIDFIIDATCT